MLSIKNAFMAVLITLALVVFVIFWDAKPEIFMRQKQAPVSVLPAADSYMRNTVTRKFSETGEPAFLLNSINGEYFKNQNKFVMTTPQVIAHATKKRTQPWHLTAKQSVILNNGQQIKLLGDVYAWQQVGSADSSGKTEITTPDLTYYPDTQDANTDKNISFTTQGHNIKGIGFSGNFASQTYQIHSRVKGKHNAYN